MLCRIGSSVIETSELSTVIPQDDGFLITMKNGQQLSATDGQVMDVYRATEESAPITAATLKTVMSDHTSKMTGATRYVGDQVKDGFDRGIGIGGTIRIIR